MPPTLGISEKTFSQQVYDLARYCGWRGFRFPPWRATATSPGVPDLWLLRPPKLLVIELKSEKGKLSPAQEEWLGALQHVETIEAFCWKPAHWPLIEEALRR